MVLQKKVFLVFVSFMILASLITFASALKVSNVPITDTIASELSIPAKYNVTIKNDMPSQKNFSIYSLGNVNLIPNLISVDPNSEITFTLSVLPLNRQESDMSFRAYTYYFKVTGEPAIEDSFQMKVASLNRILITDLPTEVSREDQEINFILRNKDNIDLGTFNYTLESDLFTSSDTVNLPVKSTKEKTIQVNLQDKQAGTYNIKFIAFLNNEYVYTKEIPVTLLEISNIQETKDRKWKFFGYTTTITKTNEGNARKIVTTELKLGTFESGFTDYNIPPISKTKQEGKIVVTWQRELQPGESYTIEAKTDYSLLAIIIIVLAVILITYLTFFKRKVIFKKKVIKLQTKSDQFAVKVILLAKNVGREVRDVKIIDRPPMNTQFYEKFGTVKPDKVEKSRIEWNFASLLPGEEVVVSYIVYSKIGMTGVQLPSATLNFVDSRNQRRNVFSGRAYVL